MKDPFSAAASRFLSGLALAGALMVGGAPIGATDAQATDLIVNIDEASIHRLMRDAMTIVVGNPSIADVSVQGGSMLLVMGKNPGHTNIIALDRKGEEIENVVVHVRNVGNRQLTLQMGSNRVTYNCAPKCDRTLTVGDGEQPFSSHMAQVQGKATISQGTSDQSAGAGQ